METLFDHNPTPGELTELFGSVMTKEEYQKFPADADTANADIMRLYVLRRDETQARIFLNRIKSAEYRMDITLQDVFH